MSWRPENWVQKRQRHFWTHQLTHTRQIDYEAGADAMMEAQIARRPSEDEIRVKIIDTLWGGSDVPELFEWLKEKLLVK